MKNQCNDGVVRSVKYRCLHCGRNGIIGCKKTEYKEVTICPDCNGLYVDLWKVEKYKHLVKKYKDLVEDVACEKFAVYFQITSCAIVIVAKTLEVTDNEVIFKDENNEIVAFYDRNQVKSVLKSGSYEMLK